MMEMDDRLKWADDNFFIKKKEIGVVGAYKIVRRKDYLGVDLLSDEEILQTIFDSVEIIPNDLAKVNIADKWGVYDLKNHVWVIEPICSQLLDNKSCNSIECIVCEKHGLIDIQSRRLVVKPEYEDVSQLSAGDYIWVKQYGMYHYVEIQTGLLIHLPNANYAYDNNNTMFAQINNKVVCIDEKGCIDKLKFRELMVQSKGRLRLENLKDHTIHIVNEYGFIIN